MTPEQTYHMAVALTAFPLGAACLCYACFEAGSLRERAIAYDIQESWGYYADAWVMAVVAVLVFWLAGYHLAAWVMP